MRKFPSKSPSRLSFEKVTFLCILFKKFFDIMLTASDLCDILRGFQPWRASSGTTLRLSGAVACL